MEITEPDLESKLPAIRPVVRAAISTYVRRAEAKYGDELDSITLYGSQARGDASLDSDIDLFVILRKDSSFLRRVLAELAWQVQFEHDVVISDVIRSKGELHKDHIKLFPYYKNIEIEGILLWKNMSEPMPAYD